MQEAKSKTLLIVGVHGFPAAYGGFETFADRLARYLVARGWRVCIYCRDGSPAKRGPIVEDETHGVTRLHVPVRMRGHLSTLEYDLRSMRDAARRAGTILILGYGTASFAVPLIVSARHVVTNMDGIEWQRRKWSPLAKLWLWLNDWVASLTSPVLVADHPRIAEHLATRGARKRVRMIPYGADFVESAPAEMLSRFGVRPQNYFLSICRLEPENQVLEIVRAAGRFGDGIKMVCLGAIDHSNPYHAAVLAQAGANVVFPGAIFDPEVTAALRKHCLAYVHGHTVGGTNPSLVEAMGAGCAIIADDNIYNRWTAGGDQLYFSTEVGCLTSMRRAIDDPQLIERARASAAARFRAEFLWDRVLAAYEDILTIRPKASAD